MQNLKQKAIQLRKQGKTYLQIQHTIHVSKSTLSLWLRDVELRPSLKEKIFQRGRKKSIDALVKRNKEQTNKARERAQEIRNKFSQEVSQINKRELFFLGIALYLGEGYKRGAEGAKWKCVDIANSDPEVIRIMMRFFRECCNVKDKEFRLFLSLHERAKEEEAIKYWMEQTKLKKENFIKTSFVQSSSSKFKYPKRLTHGTIHIRIYNTDFFHKIIGWIDGIRKMM